MECLYADRLYLLLVWYSLLSATAARIDKGPENVGARVGSSIQLKCLLGRRSCERVLWSRTEQTGSTDTVYAGNEMYNDHDGRYSVNISLRGECTLHINRLQLSDAGTFCCAERQMKKLAIVTVIESRPVLEMNATADDIVDGDTVTLSCSLRYRSSSNVISRENTHVVIDHPGAEEIDTETKRDIDEISSVVVLKVKSSKHTEEPTSFGPVKCRVDFMPPANDAELAMNPVRFPANVIRASHVLSPVSNIWFEPDTELSPGKNVTCKADGHPRPSVSWIRTSNNATVAHNPTFTAKSANYSYICRATNIVRGQVYTVTSSEVNFYVAKRPTTESWSVLTWAIASVTIAGVFCLVAATVLLGVCLRRRRTSAGDLQSGYQHYETIALRNEDSSPANQYDRINIPDRTLTEHPVYANTVAAAPVSSTAREFSAADVYVNVATAEKTDDNAYLEVLPTP